MWQAKVARLVVTVGFGLYVTPVMVQAQAPTDTLKRIKETKTITIAYRESSLPFSYLDANRKPVGYAIDLCLNVVDAVRRELKLDHLDVAYVAVGPSTRIGAIVDGKADIECGSTTNNVERRQKVAFTIPHFVAAVRMLVKSDSQIRTWTDLRGKRVVTTKGTTPFKLLTDMSATRVPGMQILEAKDHAQSFDMLTSGDAVAFLMDDVLLYGFKASVKNPEGLIVVGEPLSAEPYAIMLRKGDPKFKSVVDREMSRLILDGTLVKIYDKWFLNPIPPNKANLKMPMSFLLRDTLRFPTDKVGD
jgi:ABC-type amino acid transport substrate-binding protein